MRGAGPPAATSCALMSRAAWLLPLPGRPRSTMAKRRGRELRPGPDSSSRMSCFRGDATGAAASVDSAWGGRGGGTAAGGCGKCA